MNTEPQDSAVDLYAWSLTLIDPLIDPVERDRRIATAKAHIEGGDAAAVTWASGWLTLLVNWLPEDDLWHQPRIPRAERYGLLDVNLNPAGRDDLTQTLLIRESLTPFEATQPLLDGARSGWGGCRAAILQAEPGTRFYLLDDALRLTVRRLRLYVLLDDPARYLAPVWLLHEPTVTDRIEPWLTHLQTRSGLYGAMTLELPGVDANTPEPPF
jgi:hypothetical protein